MKICLLLRARVRKPKLAGTKEQARVASYRLATEGTKDNKGRSLHVIPLPHHV